MRCWACAGMLRRGRAPIPAHRQAAAAHQDAPPCGFAGGVLEKGDKHCPWPARNDAAMAACAKKITAAPRWRPPVRGACAAFGERGASPPYARLRGSHSAFCRAAARLYGWRGAEAAFYSPAGRKAVCFAVPSCVFSGVRGQKNTLRGFCRTAFCKCRYPSFSFPLPVCRLAVIRGWQSGR